MTNQNPTDFKYKMIQILAGSVTSLVTCPWILHLPPAMCVILVISDNDDNWWLTIDDDDYNNNNSNNNNTEDSNLPILEISRNCSFSDSMLLHSVSTIVSTWTSFTLFTSGPRLQSTTFMLQLGYITTPCLEKTFHLWLAITLTQMNEFWYFWQNCYG